MDGLFYKRMMVELIQALPSFYRDNFDFELSKPNKVEKLEIILTGVLQKFSKFCGRKGDVSITVSRKNNFYMKNMEKFKVLHDYLCDEESKKRLVELLVFRALGPLKVKLSLNTKAYWQGRKDIGKYQLSDALDVKTVPFNISLFDLKPCGYDLKLYLSTHGIHADFILQQYNYNEIICVNEGDIVIDAGACWGDTALYFASRGAKVVYSFEFIPSNLDLFKKNINLNPHFKEKICIIHHPLWSESKVPLSYDDRGPASQVAEAGKYQGSTETLTIDDLVEEKQLESVDFIKMDIEGAEMAALKGAEETIRRFKPKLAISVYHKPDDMIVIPEYIRSLNPDYKFYLDYYTTVGWEIMLYAIDDHAS